MKTKKNAGRKKGGKKSPENLDAALFGDYHENAVFLVMETRSRMNKIPQCADTHEEEDCLIWRDLVGGMIIDSIMQEDNAAVLLFEGLAKVLKDKRVNKKGDWKEPVDPERTEAAIIAMKQHDERPEWHESPMTEAEFIKRLSAVNPKAGDQRRTGGRIARQMRVKIIPGIKGRPKK